MLITEPEFSNRQLLKRGWRWKEIHALRIGALSFAELDAKRLCREALEELKAKVRAAAEEDNLDN